MQVRNKLFPYPIINHNKVFSSYGELDFKIVFEEDQSESSLILRNCHYESDSNLINQLFDEGKIGIVLIIECSYTVQRKSIHLSKVGQDIELLKADYSGNVDISMFAYAEENFVLQSSELDEDYQNIPFEIEKYDIIGANDGMRVNFRHEEIEDNFAHSIFSIIEKVGLDNGKYLVQCESSRKIEILLSEIDYRNYQLVYNCPPYKEVFFNSMLVPALIQGLYKCRDYMQLDGKDIEDTKNEYSWFNSICISYKKLKGKELTLETLNNESIVEIAQELLGKSFGDALAHLREQANFDEEEENNE